MSQAQLGSVIVELSIPTAEFELGEILRPPPGLQIELAEFVPVEEGVIPYLYVENSTERFREFERRVQNDERVNVLRVVDAQGGKRLFRVEWERPPDGFLANCLDDEVIVEHGLGTREEWSFTLRFIDHDALTRFQGHCSDADIPLRIHRITNPGTNPDSDGPSDPYGLTATQAETIRMAFEEGYFETPRKITLSELGGKLGVTRQAVSYRLRDGLSQLVDSTLMVRTGEK